MEWTDLRISVATGDTERAADIAREAVPGGVYIEDYSDMEAQVLEIAHIDLIDEELLAQDRGHSVLHLYISPEKSPAEALSFLRERLDALGIAHTISSAGVCEEDWANAWKAFYHPTKLGERVVVCPSWESYTPTAGEVVMTLDPGMAFGSGTHQTTRLCCARLERLVTPQSRLLDMGCGSGILSVAALLLGAQSAVGVDIDPTAVRTAQENAALNSVESRFCAYSGDIMSDKALSDTVGGGYDIIAANIVADVIIMYAAELWTRLRTGGTLVTSGIIGEREAEVVSALEAVGFRRLDADHLDGWAAVIFTK